jgi:Flp pilus assembly protein TadD
MPVAEARERHSFLPAIPAQPAQAIAMNASSSAVKALARPGGRNIAQQRGYQRQDLYAIAEIAHHYLFSGGTEVARALFEGLVAVAPEESYFALGLGLTHDHLGEIEQAARWYKLAGDLDPKDGRPDINRAELYLERRDYEKARQLLVRGAEKARRRRDVPLERKAMALIAHLARP